MKQRCIDCEHYGICDGEPSCLLAIHKGGWFFSPMPIKKGHNTRYNKCDQYVYFDRYNLDNLWRLENEKNNKDL